MNNYKKISLLLLTFISYITISMEQQPIPAIAKNPPSLKFQSTYKLLQPLEECHNQEKCQEIKEKIAQLPQDLKEYASGLAEIITKLKEKNILIKENPAEALFVAIELELTDLFDDLIKLGVDINGNYPATPLMFATDINRVKSINELIKLGAEVDGKKSHYHTALHRAVLHSNLPALRALVEHGADINSKDDNGNTALHRALELWNPDRGIINFLINNGADINAKSDMFEDTPLMRAVQTLHISLVKLFLEKGARLDLRNINGQAALDIAQEMQLEVIAQDPEDIVKEKDLQEIINLLLQYQK